MSVNRKVECPYFPLLIAIWTGRKPTQRTFEMVGWYMIGMANDKELTDHIESLKMKPNSKTPE